MTAQNGLHKGTVGGHALHKSWLVAARGEPFDPGIIGMGADAVDSDDSRIKLLAPIDQALQEEC